MRFSGLSRIRNIAIAAIALVALAAVACGSDPTPAAPAALPTETLAVPTIAPTPVEVVIEAPTATPEPTPEPEHKLPVSQPVVFDSGDTDTDELDGPAAHIQARAAERYEAFRLKDWDAYLDSCHPSSRAQTTVADLERDYALIADNKEISPEGFSFQVGNVMVIGAIDAMVEKYVYQFGEKIEFSESNGGDWAEIWTDVDGEWYSSACGLLK